jgi:hypothetical protein
VGLLEVTVLGVNHDPAAVEEENVYLEFGQKPTGNQIPSGCGA